MYAKYVKRPLDFVLSLTALTVLSPLLLVLTVVGAIAMKGNPFFVQKRPGRISKKTGQEKIFSLIKFRTMSNAKDKDGNLLPDKDRLNRYGRFLRSTSLDELPELANIVKGDMAIVGPRPLLVEYLPYYTDEERKRHMIRPGLIPPGGSIEKQAVISWNKQFVNEVWYAHNITFALDVKIIVLAFYIVLQREKNNYGEYVRESLEEERTKLKMRK